jgi:steroid delta-isomerase-like uncharacterized protein
MRPSALVLPAALLAVATGCAPPTDARLDANKELVRRFAAVSNAADWSGLEQLLTPDFTRHSQATPGAEVTSPAQFIELQKGFLATAPDQHVTLDLLVAEGDHVAALATYAGTQTGPLDGFPITGRPFELHFLSIFRIQDGRIAELWVEWDNVALLTQLGLFPPPAG